MKKVKFQSPSGMHDILPEDERYFQKVYKTAKNIVDFYGFQNIEPPILEETELFEKGTGGSTDIVQKQMYSFRTSGKDFLTLRPEFTPGVVRAYIEHGMFNLPQPVKLFSFGPLFRYERPQAGRYRQFYQINLEIFGEQSPIIDVQIIQIFYNILKESQLKDLIIEVNSIGDSQCRPYYKKLLIKHFRSQEKFLCLDCQRRLQENPLRILDCKEEKCQKIKFQAPQMIDYLCQQCHEHFKEVLEFLDEIELPYRLNPYLVRGLDYYTKTVFEIFIEKLSETNSLSLIFKNALASGGRYDALVKLLGGKETPAVGGGAGVERIIAAMKAEDIRTYKTIPTEIFLAQIGVLAKRKCLKLLEDFRKNKIKIAESLGSNFLGTQISRADKMGVKFILILGQKEVQQETIIIRDMKTGRQEIVKMEKAVEEIKKKLKK